MFAINQGKPGDILSLEREEAHRLTLIVRDENRANLVRIDPTPAEEEERKRKREEEGHYCRPDDAGAGEHAPDEGKCYKRAPPARVPTLGPVVVLVVVGWVRGCWW